MGNLNDYFKRRKLTFWIAFGYVGLGTLSVCSVYPDDLFYGDWALFGLLITFPVSIISFGFRYGESQMLYPVFIIQFVMFILTFFIVGSIKKSHKKYSTQQQNTRKSGVSDSLKGN